MKKQIIIFASLLCLNTALFAQTEKSNYKIAAKIPLTTDGGWDYLSVDEVTNRLFVSHGTIVQVVDLNNNTLVGTIPDTKGVHGIAVANELNKGFISNGRDTSVTIFELSTLKTITKVKITGQNPDAILYDSFSKKVFTFNGKTSNATVIDANTNKVVGTIAFKGKPEFSVSNGKGKIYVNIEDKNLVCMIDATTLKLEKEWSTGTGDEPSGLAIDIENNRLFAVCGNKLMIILDANDGHILASLPIGDRVDGVAFDTKLKRAYSSNGDGTITVVEEKDANTFKVIDPILTQKGARTIAINNKTHHFYLPTAEFGEAPKSTTENPHPRPTIKPGTFFVFDFVQQ